MTDRKAAPPGVHAAEARYAAASKNYAQAKPGAAAASAAAELKAAITNHQATYAAAYGAGKHEAEAG